MHQSSQFLPCQARRGTRQFSPHSPAINFNRPSCALCRLHTLFLIPEATPLRISSSSSAKHLNVPPRVSISSTFPSALANYLYTSSLRSACIQLPLPHVTIRWHVGAGNSAGSIALGRSSYPLGGMIDVIEPNLERAACKYKRYHASYHSAVPFCLCEVCICQSI